MALHEKDIPDAATTSLPGQHHFKKNGSIMDVDLSVRPIELDGRRALLVTALDIGGRMRAENARVATEEQLQQSQKMEVVGQLTGGIAHDFNNILTVILANADALQEEEKLDAGVTVRLGQIARAVERAADLTRRLLVFSRKQPLHPQQTDVNALVAGTGTLLRRSLGEQVEIETVLAADLCLADIDRAQLETALVNLCLNARDAMPDGGRLLIETHNVTLDEDYAAQNPEAAPGQYVLLAVTDTGGGIPPGALDRVFEPFFTTKEIGKGTGLGLSMVHGFIKQSCGHIKIYSEVGHGTTIRCYLPRGDLERVAAVVPPAAVLSGGAERILVVEDDPQVRASVVQQLQSMGYAVSQASDGTAGVKAFEAASPPFDLLLTDVVMPGPFNGRALANEVAQRWPRTKVVFMSGYTEASIVHQGRLAAGARLLSKPFRKADLAAIVRRTLDGAGVEEEPAAAA